MVLPGPLARMLPVMILAMTAPAGIYAAPDPVAIDIRDGRPVATNVYVNDHGPFRFLLDTGTSTNLIDERLAVEIGLTARFRVELATSSGSAVVPGNADNHIQMGPAEAVGQEFLFTNFTAVRDRWPDVHGVLGQRFLSLFDYRLDLKSGTLQLGESIVDGTKTTFTLHAGRAVFATSLGELVLDSGAERVTLFGVSPERNDTGAFLRTVAGTRTVGLVSKLLRIGSRAMWRGDAVAIPAKAEPGVDGLMPLSLFRSVYISNSGGYAVFE